MKARTQFATVALLIGTCVSAMALPAKADRDVDWIIKVFNPVAAMMVYQADCKGKLFVEGQQSIKNVRKDKATRELLDTMAVVWRKRLSKVSLARKCRHLSRYLAKSSVAKLVVK